MNAPAITTAARTTTLSAFLGAFFEPEESFWFRAFGPKGAPESDPRFSPKKIELKQSSLERQKAHLTQLNQTLGLYFVVNSGGNQDGSISRFNAAFFESDNRTIEEQNQLIDSSPLKTSSRVQTLRSVHGYFLLKPGCTEEQWRQIQAGLLERFGGDPKIKNPSRVMRLPYFNHVRLDEAGELQFRRVELVEFNPELRYSAEELLNAFPAPSEAKSNSHDFSFDGKYTFAELQTELRRRMITHPTAKKRPDGWIHCKGICHGGKSASAIAFNPATGALYCQGGCEFSAILQAFDLPEKPNSSEDATEKKEPLARAFSVASFEKRVVELHKNGLPPGEDLGWKSLSELYKPRRGEWTLVSGIPGHGKTEFLDNVIVRLGVLGWKIAIFSAEKQPIESHIASLVEKAAGVAFEETKYSHRINERDLKNTLEILNRSLCFIEFLDESPTLDRILETATAVKSSSGLDGLVIDPWNELEHAIPNNLNETLYVSQSLTKVRRFSRQNQVHT